MQIAVLCMPMLVASGQRRKSRATAKEDGKVGGGGGGGEPGNYRLAKVKMSNKESEEGKEICYAYTHMSL